MLHAYSPSRLRKGILLMDEGMLAAGYGIADDLPDPLPGEIGIREDDDTSLFMCVLYFFNGYGRNGRSIRFNGICIHGATDRDRVILPFHHDDFFNFHISSKVVETFSGSHPSYRLNT